MSLFTVRLSFSQQIQVSMYHILASIRILLDNLLLLVYHLTRCRKAVLITRESEVIR
jgi:hypothetical protein